jgi:lipopolysaccharide/colanic/teichoic acid biosynthesis glycosyltransferase
MINFFIGFISGLFGFIFSPQYRFSGDIFGDIKYVVSRSLLIGVCLSVASVISGHNRQMLMRSRLDYFVQLLIASFFGIIAAVFFLYCFSYQVIGRWVFVISLGFYNTIVWVVSLIKIRLGGGKVIIFGKGAILFDQMISELGFYHLKDVYTCLECCIDSGAVQKVFASIRNGTTCYILNNPNGNFNGLDYNVRNRVYSIAQVIEGELGVVSLDSCRGLNWWDINTPLRSGEFIFIKRLLDIALSGLLAIVGAPLIVLFGLGIKICDGGEVFYSQIRLGQYGRPFKIYKLRTMRANSEMSGAQWASKSDSRVTYIGKFLRKTRIDELPQIWNILCGDMSFIGPRPERPEFYELIGKELPEFLVRLVCKPGLTGWAQVNFHYGASVRDSRVKLYYDMYYIKRASLILELRVLTRTVIAMVRGAR